MPKRAILPITTVEYLKSGDVVAALLSAATDLEQLLFEKLFFEKEIKAELIENWTLGRLIEWNLKLGLVDSKYSDFLHRFKKLRNRFVHTRFYIEKIRKDKQQAMMVRKIVEECILFVSEVKSEYRQNWRLEREYSGYMDKLK